MLLNEQGAWAAEGPESRFILFYQLPMTLWLTEMFLDALEFDYVAIRSAMGPGARSAATPKAHTRGVNNLDSFDNLYMWSSRP